MIKMKLTKMNRSLSFFYRGVLFLSSLLLLLSSCTESRRGLAVVIDEESYRKLEAEIADYRAVLEEEGLEPHLIVKDYENPDSLRLDLFRLYKGDEAIEGAVFIGDIPMVAVIDAQHMTSAFKMDQDRYGLETANVVTDRFYDDFDLKWDYIRKDTTGKNIHYYSLNYASPQEIGPDIYSGRIKAPAGEDKYALLSAYMKKAVAAHRSENRLDQFFFFAGHGYNSESMVARLDEQLVLSQQLPGEVHISFLDHSRDEHVKFMYMSELQRKDLDLALLHHHGSADTEYLSGFPKTDSYSVQIEMVKRHLRSRLRRVQSRGAEAVTRVIKEYGEKYAIPASWFDGAFDEETSLEDSISSANLDLVLADFETYKYEPNARFVIFDACYNGSFYEDSYLAGSYLFSPGETVVAQGNTVNSLQDKWPSEMLGLLSLGMRVGEWNKMVAYLETHILGDPTFRFASIDPGIDVQGLSAAHSVKSRIWLNLLDSPYPDVVNLALQKLYEARYAGLSDLLLNTFRESEYGSIRAKCMLLSAEYNDANFLELIKLALHDDYELVQRFAVAFAGDMGHEELIPELVALSLQPLSKRVEFNLGTSLRFFDSDLLLAEFDRQSAELESFSNAKEFLPLIRGVLEEADTWFERNTQTLADPEASDKARYRQIRMLRNYNFHLGVDQYIRFVKESGNQDHRILMLEALGWFKHSLRKQQIIDFCKALAEDPETPEPLKEEALRTVLRLS